MSLMVGDAVWKVFEDSTAAIEDKFQEAEPHRGREFHSG